MIHPSDTTEKRDTATEPLWMVTGQLHIHPKTYFRWTTSKGGQIKTAL